MKSENWSLTLILTLPAIGFWNTDIIHTTYLYKIEEKPNFTYCKFDIFSDFNNVFLEEFIILAEMISIKNQSLPSLNFSTRVLKIY